MHEMHEEWEVETTYQVVRSKNKPKIMWSEGLEREKWVWKVKSLKTIERDRRCEIWNCDYSLYRNLINLDQSRVVENLSKFKMRVLAVEPANKELSRINQKVFHTRKLYGSR